MTIGKVESGMLPRQQDGSNLQGAVGQSSVDTWEHVKPGGEWIEVTADYRVLDALVKEKKATWTNKRQRKCKKEAYLYDMLEKAATERDRGELDDELEAFLKRKRRR